MATGIIPIPNDIVAINSISGNGNRTFTIPNASHHLIVISSAYSTKHALLIAGSDSSGTVQLSTVYKGDNLSFSTGTGSLTVTNTGGGSATLYDCVLFGGQITS